MIRDESDFLLSVGELSAFRKSFAVRPGLLSLLPTDEPSLEDMKTAAASLKKLSVEDQGKLRKAVHTLAEPGRIARLNHAVADESITRSVLAWPLEYEPKDADVITCVTRLGNNRRLSLRSPWELVSMLIRLLAANPDLREGNFGVRLSSLAVLTLLGVFDQFQHARLFSMLVHSSPVDSVAPLEIYQRLAESELEDFRWVLSFIEKVLPTGALVSITKDEVQTALGELANGGLIEAVDETASLYQLSGNGVFAADSIFHNLSRAAVCLSSLRPDGVIGYEMMLFLRGPAALFVYDVSGGEGVAMALSGKALEDMLLNLFAARFETEPSPVDEINKSVPNTPAKMVNIPPPEKL